MGNLMGTNETDVQRLCTQQDPKSSEKLWDTPCPREELGSGEFPRADSVPCGTATRDSGGKRDQGIFLWFLYASP